MQNMIPNRKEKGFTLIELVMVIVILGILAAFALPRFADLGEEATIATLDGAKASLKSANAMAHASCLAKSSTDCDENDGDSSTNKVDFEGQPVKMVFGYAAASVDDVKNAADLLDYNVIAGDTGKVIVQDTDQTCGFTYTQASQTAPTDPIAVPQYSAVTCGESMPTPPGI